MPHSSNPHPAPPFLFLALLAFGTACGDGQTDTPQVERPNILLVTLDTTRRDALGCYGNPHGPTPNIDALAADGVRFTRAYTVAPLTIPAHSSIHTGLWPPRHGVRDNGDFFLGDGAITLAEVLREGGYATMASVGAEVTSHHWGFAQGFDAYFDDLGSAPTTRDNRWEVERPGDEVVDDAIGWLSSPERPDLPWFAWVHLFDPHHPYEAPLAHRARFEKRPYLAEVAFADDQVGRLLAAVGDLEDTLVMVVADHGEGLGAHGESLHGVLLYNATTLVPMVFRPPGGLEEPLAMDAPTSVVDLFPTALSVAGLTTPPGLDGVDLSPSLGLAPRSDFLVDRDVYVESLYAWHHFGWAPQHALVDMKYKLIDSTTPELYPRRDLGEQHDLATTEPARLEEMRRRLEALTERMVPEERTADRAELSAERIAQLQALGYMTGGAPTTEPEADLPDPVDRLPMLRRMEASRMAVQGGDLGKAQAQLEVILAEDPGLMPTRLLLAQVYQRQGDLEAALALVEEAVEMRDTTQTRIPLAMLSLQKGDTERALDLLAGVLESDPYLTLAWVPYLHTLLGLGRMEEVEAALTRARLLMPTAPFVLAMEGVLLAQKADFAHAEPLLVNALEADPALPLSNYWLGVIARERGDDAAAETYFLTEIALSTSALRARRELVALYARNGRYLQQFEALKEVRELEPPNGRTQLALGQALFNLGRYEESREEVRRCRALEPLNADCALLQANVLDKTGEHEQAITTYHEALALAGQEPPPEAGSPRPEGK
ncbi:MAG: sulfatase-like hydrolase/transferase [Deltaproteobacteria bacterium]|nr:sulfatase-like hydrolase/transferase [Deltaproteobacteria bacterium]